MRRRHKGLEKEKTELTAEVSYQRDTPQKCYTDGMTEGLKRNTWRS